jgi:hypothetical protein
VCLLQPATANVLLNCSITLMLLIFTPCVN